VSRSLIATPGLLAVLVVAGALTLVLRTARSKVTTGAEGLIGARAVTRTALTPAGKVFVAGEWWNALADGEVPAGRSVEIVEVDGMTLKVRPVDERS